MAKLNSSNIYYGATFFDENDVLDVELKNRIELEYYGSKNESNSLTTYHIQIIKKEYDCNNIKIEQNTVKYECNNIIKVIEILEKLKKNKVTPVCLHDVMQDIIC